MAAVARIEENGFGVLGSGERWDLWEERMEEKGLEEKERRVL